ncbi:MAG: maleylpyruvate isomerase N-terminal domain-containing protein [Actinobacteria bacterium]|nr:maleylpyruvate isomerase N-terminal domain-containing protein [Actinomycetota bacterium]
MTRGRQSAYGAARRDEGLRRYVRLVVWDLFERCAEVAAALVASEAVAAAWAAPSSLPGYTVAGLAGHLARAVFTVEDYLEVPAPPPDRELTDAAGYFVVVLGSHDPRDSELHRTIRGRADTGAVGPDALAHAIRDATRRLRERRSTINRQAPVGVLDGVALPLVEYLKTRLVELVVHIDDLAVSVDQLPALPADAYRLVACVLSQVAALREGGLDVVRSLARRERHPDAVRAL